jgi:hypothetical protein
MVPRRRVAFHTRAGLGRLVFITVLTQDASTTFEEFHPVDLLETLIPAGFSANRKKLQIHKLRHRRSSKLQHLAEYANW